MPIEIGKTIGENIRSLRTQHQMTLEEVANFLHVGRSNVYKYEHGIIGVPNDKIIALCNLFHVSPNYLMGWDADSKITNNAHNKKVDTSDKLESPSLNHEEEALLVAFHVLNTVGKEKVLGYISDLIEIQKYTSFI